tara:strand:- start:556 stop:1833 length:1278 start_codon:yes stop_codon:yes gene_type:complete
MCNPLINNEIENIIKKFKKNDFNKNKIVDLTYLKTYSIDDTNTIEIDDAISLESINGKYKLWIHIASPSSYIDYGSVIDKKARKLISSVYLCRNICYMFPELLINEVFSLSNKDKRESISLGVILNDDGSVLSSEIVQSLIRVNYRLDYTEADELIDYAPKEEEDLSLISRILQTRKCWRNDLGAKEIQESYGKIIIKDNFPTLKVIDSTLSRQLISEAMILYGNLISLYTQKHKIPVPYRVQDSKNKVGMVEIKKKGRSNILNNFLLKKSMGKTYYSINPSKHDSLGLSSYIHATSPIRRYCDLLVNYQLNRYLNNNTLISQKAVENIITDLNIIGRQNTMRYREDQRFWQYKWFEINQLNEYKVILLNWVNRYKNTCILYFIEYNLSLVCNLKSELEIKVGDTIKIKNISNNVNDIIFFQLCS